MDCGALLHKCTTSKGEAFLEGSYRKGKVNFLCIQKHCKVKIPFMFTFPFKINRFPGFENNDQWLYHFGDIDWISETDYQTIDSYGLVEIVKMK